MSTEFTGKGLFLRGLSLSWSIEISLSGGAGLYCLKLQTAGQLPVDSETGLLGLHVWKTVKRLGSSEELPASPENAICHFK